MPKFISWNTANDGTLVESDLKFFPCDDGTYDIETTSESIGFILGLDKVSKKYTVVLDVVDKKRVQKMKTLISIGDVLVSVNERVVLEEPFSSVAALLEIIIQGGYKRRMKFLNPKKVSVAVYLQKLEQSGRLQTDMLGFNCSFEYKLDERAFRAASFNATIQRDREWVEYLKSIGGPENLKPAGIFKPSPDLKALVRRGIPVAFRASVWQRISLSTVYRAQFPANYYESLLARVEELNPKVKNDIEKDVDRTFPEHMYFEPSGQGESGLRRVLQAFALHNTDVGYCQSLNFVAGMMLIFLQEEDAFWLLVTIVEKLLPPDYYTKSMVGTYVDQFVLAHIIKKCLPRIHNAFEVNQLQLPLITVQWFMCLFVNTLRPEVTLRVWDMFLNEGSKVLFRVAAALFKLHEPQLLTVKDAADLFSALRTIGKSIVDADVLIAAAYKSHAAKMNINSSSSGVKAGPAPGGPPSGPVTTPTIVPKNKQSSRSQLISLDNFVNPRLKSSTQGQVPRDLTGLGLAHTGPLPKAASAPDLTTNSSSASQLSSSSSSSSSVPSSPSSPSNVIDQGYLQSHIGELNNVDFVSGSASIVGSSPKKDGSGLIASSDRYSAEYLTPEKLKVRKSAQSGKKTNQRNGDLNFYRSDILLWRASFRPALEERHVKMEAARKAWSSKNNSLGSAAGGHSKSLASSSGERSKNSLKGSPEAIRKSLSNSSNNNKSSSSDNHNNSSSNSSSADSAASTPVKRPAMLSSLSVDMSVVSRVLPEDRERSGEQQHQVEQEECDGGLSPTLADGSPVRVDSFQLQSKSRSESITPIGYMEQLIPLSGELDLDCSVEGENEQEEEGEMEGPVNTQEDESPSLLDEGLNDNENGSIIPTFYRSSFTAAASAGSPAK